MPLSIKAIRKNRFRRRLPFFLVSALVFAGFFYFLSLHLLSHWKSQKLLVKLERFEDPSKTYKHRLAADFPDFLYLFAITKRQKKMHVYLPLGNDLEEIASFPITYGEKEGNKELAGDLKTPEGNYWIIGMRAGSTFGARYGALVFPINYPNESDMQAGRTGSGIWIHGENIRQLKESTRGCIRLNNKDIMTLFKYVKPPTPVMILPLTKKSDELSLKDFRWVIEEHPEMKEFVTKAQKSVKLPSRSAIFKKAKVYMDFNKLPYY